MMLSPAYELICHCGMAVLTTRATQPSIAREKPSSCRPELAILPAEKTGRQAGDPTVNKAWRQPHKRQREMRLHVPQRHNQVSGWVTASLAPESAQVHGFGETTAPQQTDTAAPKRWCRTKQPRRPGGSTRRSQRPWSPRGPGLRARGCCAAGGAPSWAAGARGQVRADRCGRTGAGGQVRRPGYICRRGTRGAGWDRPGRRG